MVPPTPTKSKIIRGRHRCTDFGHIFKFSWGPFFIEGLYVGNMNQAFFFHLNFFSRFARQKTKIFQKNWILGFFHIYFKARIVRASLNIALIMLFQYMKRNPSIKIYFSTFCQKTKFSDSNYHFWIFFSENLPLIMQ